MRFSLPNLSRDFVWRRRAQLLGLLGAALGLQVAAGVGLAYLAGPSKVDRVINHFHPIWLAAMGGALVLSFVGYYFVYGEIYRVEDGPTLSRRQMRAVVTAGFGGFLAHGGAALDHYALEAAGAKKREARVRVASLGGLEHGILGIGGCGAAITVLGLGLGAPPLDFTLPWAIVPVPGFLIAFSLANRYRDRFRGKDGWRRHLGVFVDSILLIRELFREPLQHAPALLGMAVFWAADLFAAWAGMAMFGFHMDGAQLVVGLATGMIFSRRTGPLGGAGILSVVLALTVMYSGAPFAVAVTGIFAYRVFALWLPMPFALASLPTLREIGQNREPEAEGVAETSEGEPALEERRAG